MRKKSLKFFSNPTHDPSFERIQAKWYSRLKREGFEDQEDAGYADRPLKRWTGISSIYIDKFPSSEGSSFPECKFENEEAFLHHPEFKDICATFCKHGNSKLKPWKVKRIWMAYCDGKTERQMEIRFKVSDTTVRRVILAVTEWMNLVDNREIKEDTIITRKFKPETDNAIIYSTWRNSIWFDEKREEAQANEFYSQATKAIKGLLELPTTEVRIACSKAEPDFIAGYSVMSSSHLHFVYVKINFRKTGIAKLLTKGVRTVEEPSTKVGRKIAESHKLEVKENHGTVQ